MKIPFSATKFIVVKPGYTFHDDMKGVTYMVTKGNMVIAGNGSPVYLVQEDYDALKAKFGTAEGHPAEQSRPPVRTAS